MKSFCLGFLLLSLVYADAKEIDIDGGNITFDVPDDFTSLTQDEIARKFPMRNGRIEAVGNDTRAVSISYGLTQNAVTLDQLPQLKESLTGLITKFIPNTQLVKSDYIALNGSRWIILEVITPSMPREVHNIILATSYRGVMLLINFNSDEKFFNSYQDQLWASIRSVKVKDAETVQSPLPSSTEPQVSADEEVARGQAALRDGNLVLAKEAFTVALLLAPGKPSALSGLNQVEAKVNPDKEGSPEASQNDAQVPSRTEFFTGWSDTTFAMVGSAALIGVLTLLVIVLWLTMRSSRRSSVRRPYPIDRVPPMK